MPGLILARPGTPPCRLPPNMLRPLRDFVASMHHPCDAEERPKFGFGPGNEKESGRQGNQAVAAINNGADGPWVGARLLKGSEQGVKDCGLQCQNERHRSASFRSLNGDQPLAHRCGCRRTSAAERSCTCGVVTLRARSGLPQILVDRKVRGRRSVPRRRLRGSAGRTGRPVQPARRPSRCRQASS